MRWRSLPCSGWSSTGRDFDSAGCRPGRQATVMNDRQYVINLSRQMADCDANYIRLLKLMPELESFRIKCLESLASTASYGNQEGAVPNFRSRDFYTVGAAGSEADCTREFVTASPVGGGEEVRV